MNFIAPCHFGLEAVLKREISDLGYEVSSVEDGRVTFTGDENAICRANVFLRTAERVLLKVGTFSGNAEYRMGRVYSGGRKVLGGEGSQYQEQAFQPVRYSVHYEKGYGRTFEGGLS